MEQLWWIDATNEKIQKTDVAMHFLAALPAVQMHSHARVERRGVKRKTTWELWIISFVTDVLLICCVYADEGQRQMIKGKHAESSHACLSAAPATEWLSRPIRSSGWLEDTVTGIVHFVNFCSFLWLAINHRGTGQLLLIGCKISLQSTMLCPVALASQMPKM